VSGGGFLLPESPVATLDDYRAAGGGGALETAYQIGPDAVVAEIRAAGLRGRGGAGFPTGIKWSGLRSEEGPRYLACNGAEGEPGTFKDRMLMRRNPYQLIEGIAVAAFAMGAAEAYLATKASFTFEVERLEAALVEMAGAGMAGTVPIVLVTGPGDYLFGEEKAMLEVVAGRDPLPTLYPPYVQGLFGDGVHPNPTVVNNVETLSNVPQILRNGAAWFRSIGTEDTPGTMVFTISGDVRRHAVAELPMGTPLSELVYGVGGGFAAGRGPKAVLSGVSNAPLVASQIDTPMDFGSMRRAGSGLGSGGFVAFDDSACMAQVAAEFSRFLWAESCGQCPPCKLGAEALTDRFGRIAAGTADMGVLEEAAAWTARVTDANRCGLGAGQRGLAAGFLERFWDDFAAHAPSGCGRRRSGPLLPVLVDLHGDRFVIGPGPSEPQPT
jgi:NADH:ubiquinone oxidoreductase subunit F (NADH-binding)